MAIWQDTWVNGQKERTTYDNIKTVRHKHLKLNRKAIQILTGHGNMNAYLRRFNLQDTDGTCDIDNVTKDANHIIYNCTRDKKTSSQIIT